MDNIAKAQWLLGDRGNDVVQGCRQAKGIQLRLPGRRSRKEPVRYAKRRHQRHSHIEIMFGRLKHSRRVATRYDRCPTAFFSAVSFTATVTSDRIS